MKHISVSTSQELTFATADLETLKYKIPVTEVSSAPELGFCIRENNLGFFLDFRLGSGIADSIIPLPIVLWSHHEVKKEIGMRLYRQTDRQTDRKSDRLIGRPSGRQAGRRTATKTDRQSDRVTS